MNVEHYADMFAAMGTESRLRIMRLLLSAHPQVRSEAIAVMREIGIDISGHHSKSVDEFAGQGFDYVITVCDNAKESCPVFPARTLRLHWPFMDPAAVQGSAEVRLAAFREIRDQIQARIRDFSGIQDQQ